MFGHCEGRIEPIARRVRNERIPPACWSQRRAAAAAAGESGGSVAESEALIASLYEGGAALWQNEDAPNKTTARNEKIHEGRTKA